MSERLPVPGADRDTWGEILNDFLGVAHDSAGYLKPEAVGFYNVRDYGATGNGITDDRNAIQNAIFAALDAGGGIVYLPAGIYLISATPLVACKSTGASATGLSVRILGAGMYATILKCGQTFQYNGMLGYGASGIGNPVIAQVHVSDLTFDGNYVGQGGTLAAISGAGLVSLGFPWTSESSPPNDTNGLYHTFHRVRFYRPSGYVFQPTKGIYLEACLFDKCGQPEQEVVNYDNLGSGLGDAIVIGCMWKDSSGNYADFVSAVDTQKVRLVFIGNISINHRIGGIYACGDRSIIVGNRLVNNEAGSGIGYDGSTSEGNRNKNIVAHNVLTNITVDTSGLAATYGDRIIDNLASDQPAGASTITVGSSPYTYTAGPTPEVVYISDGTVSSVAKNSQTLFAVTNCTVFLDPGESITVTYSSLPTMKKDKK